MLRPADDAARGPAPPRPRLTVGDEVVWIKLLGGGSLVLAMPMLLGFRRAHPEFAMVLITTPAVKPVRGADRRVRRIPADRRARRVPAPLDVGRSLSRTPARRLHRRSRGSQPADDRVHDAHDGAEPRELLARGHFLATRTRVASRVLQSFVRELSLLRSHRRSVRRAGRESRRIAARARAMPCVISLAVASGAAVRSPSASRAPILAKSACSTPEQWVHVSRDNLRPEHRDFRIPGRAGRSRARRRDHRGAARRVPGR